MDLRMLVPIMGILLVMIPVAGITFALTLRYAVKPFVETLAAALRESGGLSSGERAETLALMESVDALREEVARLRDERSFDRQLLGGTSPGDPDHEGG